MDPKISGDQHDKIQPSAFTKHSIHWLFWAGSVDPILHARHCLKDYQRLTVWHIWLDTPKKI